MLCLYRYLLITTTKQDVDLYMFTAMICLFIAESFADSSPKCHKVILSYATVSFVSIIAAANLIDVELGQSVVEHEI